MFMPQDLPDIMIVEQEYRLRIRFRSLLKRAGWQLAGEAKDLAESLAHLREDKPGCILLHWQGEETDFVLVKKLAETAPVMLLGSLTGEMAFQAARAGIYGCLPDSAGDEELLAALAVALARWQEAQALRQETEELRDLLALRKILDQAKGILMKKHHMSEQEAHRRIQRYAMYKRLTVKSVAEAIIKATGGKA